MALSQRAVALDFCRNWMLERQIVPCYNAIRSSQTTSPILRPLFFAMKPSLALALFFVFDLVEANAAGLSPTPTPVDYQKAPIARFEYGLVRVWNAKEEPPQEVGRVPEARLGDALVAEVKYIDAWLCANLDAGAWANDPDVLSADPLLRKVIEARNLSTTIRAGKWLRMMKNADDSPSGPEDPAATDEKNIKLLAALKTSLDLNDSVLPTKDENGNSLDAGKGNDATRIVETCRKAVSFLTTFRARKATEFVLSINDTRLPGLAVTAQESRSDWRSASDRMEEGDYTWWRIKLRASGDPELDKGWSDLMHAVEPHFSLESRLNLSLPDELVAMPTNVTPTVADSRCRFVLIAIAQLPRVEKKMTKGEAVYPLDLRERTKEIRRGEIVEVDVQNSTAPYVVHFQDAGGSKHYASKDLARLPPDPVPQGVVRVWNTDETGSEWEEAQRNDIPVAKIGDYLAVEVRNFDGWLCNQIDQGLLKGDLLLQQASPSLKKIISDKNFSNAVLVGGAIYRLSHKTQNTSADIVRQLQKDSRSNPDLAALPFPTLGPPKPIKRGELKNANWIPTPTPTPTSASTLKPTPTPAEAKKETPRKDDETSAKQFLAPYQEAHSLLRELVKAKLRALNLTINDIPLGITPDNSDFAPIYESRRPPGLPEEDTYHWLRFFMTPKSTAAVKDEEQTTDDPFKRLLEKPSFTMPSKVTLTLKSGAETLALPTAVTPQAKDKRCRFGLIGIQQWLFYLAAVVFGLIGFSLGYFAASTNILRDPCRRRPEGVEAVSLARLQMAFWFVVIAAAFLFLWLTTGNIATINTTCLVLLAIGTTTAYTSAKITDSNQGQKDLASVLGKTPREMLEMTPLQVQQAVQARKKELEEAPIGSITPEELELERKILTRHEEEIDCFLKRRPRWLPAMIYFWNYRLRTIREDLLTEETGTYDFHRFQILAWTLVLGSVFVVKVFHDRVMPTFDSNVLLLMGISSGAYLTFKKVATDRAEEAKKEAAKVENQDADPKPPAKPAASA
ncbi:MAG: hypothetical protein DLM73_05500 [Chthoniobacterales bacterium]|nr:MAG: hypothetical protein DLM73_05500 [Chthoniobacterales bacterium]